jgi:hypothetical protein
MSRSYGIRAPIKSFRIKSSELERPLGRQYFSEHRSDLKSFQEHFNVRKLNFFLNFWEVKPIFFQYSINTYLSKVKMLVLDNMLLHGDHLCLFPVLLSGISSGHIIFPITHKTFLDR